MIPRIRILHLIIVLNVLLVLQGCHGASAKKKLSSHRRHQRSSSVEIIVPNDVIIPGDDFVPIDPMIQSNEITISDVIDQGRKALHPDITGFRELVVHSESSLEVSKAELTNEVSDIVEEPSDELNERPRHHPRLNKDKNVRRPQSAEIEDRLDNGDVGFDYQCTACQIGSEILFRYHKMGWSPTNILKYLSTLCSTFKIQSENVCSGLVQSVGQQLFAILDLANDTISPKDLCGMVYGGHCALQSKRLNDWFLDIPDLKVDPPTQPLVWPKEPTPVMDKVLHLSDTHLQLDYTPGMSISCDKPICCSAHDGRPTSPDLAAGPFGDYHCDLPKWTFEEIVKQAKVEHPDVKYIFLTGDFPAHDIWRQNRTLNIESVRTVVKLLEEHFPDAHVFPAIGNHESFPVNMFPDPSVPDSRYAPTWLYSNMADIYRKWLPDEEQQSTLKEGGFYSVLIRPGLRVISVNTNFCNNYNFWLLLNFADPHQHLHWVYRQLHKAEVNKERVYLLGHIPPGSESCLDRWSREYNRLTNRFRNTIVGQFFGHTHLDEFQIFFSTRPRRTNDVISVAYLAPSQTPHDGLNPAYRVYTIDGDHVNTTNLILDHETFWLNLTEANDEALYNSPERNNTLRMRKEYSARTDFALEDMSPASWLTFVERMATDNAAFDKFRQFHSRFGPHYFQNPCDEKCKEDLLCSLVTSRITDQTGCKRIKKLMTSHQKNLLRTSPVVQEEPSHPWWSFFWPSSSSL